MDAANKRIGRKTTEHDRVDCPNPRTGEQRHRRFRDHRQVNRHAVALLNALCLENIGHAADLFVQLTIGDVARLFCGNIWLPDNRNLIATFFQMTVDTIAADVQLAIGEPVDVEGCRIERPIAGDFRAFDPVETLGLFQPECARIRQRPAIDFRVFCRIDARLLRPFGRNRKQVLIRHHTLPLDVWLMGKTRHGGKPLHGHCDGFDMLLVCLQTK